jgi:hypothetical protein
MARIITFLIFGSFTVMFLYVGLTQLLQQRRNLTHAERIDATIVHSAVRSNTTRDTDGRVGFTNNTTTHTPDVRFRYTVSGEQYESEQLYPTIIGRGYASLSDAAAVLAPFPVDAKVRAYVDRAHPQHAFLINESTSGPIVFLVLGLCLPLLGWLVAKYII